MHFLSAKVLQRIMETKQCWKVLSLSRLQSSETPPERGRCRVCLLGSVGTVTPRCVFPVSLSLGHGKHGKSWDVCVSVVIAAIQAARLEEALQMAAELGTCILSWSLFPALAL